MAGKSYIVLKEQVVVKGTSHTVFDIDRSYNLIVVATLRGEILLVSGLDFSLLNKINAHKFCITGIALLTSDSPKPDSVGVVSCAFGKSISYHTISTKPGSWSRLVPVVLLLFVVVFVWSSH
eukprot:TRINITY_DN8573_c0_g1_i5.p2 TRINITY_DN8573_c0_g1~~TRINITY_DN8573_c0_g1_i5.p2  ORF type:complete len:122 (-),score=18.40 TRINITY_DN8573_c0_g1_i5:74-439(-)